MKLNPFRSAEFSLIFSKSGFEETTAGDSDAEAAGSVFS